jgi:hypothetical protein
MQEEPPLVLLEIILRLAVVVQGQSVALQQLLLLLVGMVVLALRPVLLDQALLGLAVVVGPQ